MNCISTVVTHNDPVMIPPLLAVLLIVRLAGAAIEQGDHPIRALDEASETMSQALLEQYRLRLEQSTTIEFIKSVECQYTEVQTNYSMLKRTSEEKVNALWLELNNERDRIQQELANRLNELKVNYLFIWRHFLSNTETETKRKNI